MENRIAGGFASNPGAFPYFTTVHPSSHVRCGASLIYKDILLTSAHCAGAFANGVRIGAHDFGNPDDGVHRNVVQEIPHPNYNPDWLGFDIMLLKLDSTVEDIQPVLWGQSRSEPDAEKTLTIMGFGSTSQGGDTATELHQVDIEAANLQDCYAQYPEIDFDTMFCASVPGKGQGHCQGDTGGPVIDENNVQIGIASRGTDCTSATHLGVYTRVGRFRQWIEDMICQHSSDPLSDFCSYVDGDSTPWSGVDSQGNTILYGRLKVFYDQYPEETSWQLYEGCADCDHETINAGPEDTPAPFQTLRTILELRPGKEYTFMLEDTHGDGFDGRFEIYLIRIYGQESLLVSGPAAPFEQFVTVSFTVPEPYASTRSICTDSTTTIPLENGVHGDCATISSSRQELGYLCGYMDVALECPYTCGLCTNHVSLQEQGCGTDLPGVVDMGDVVGERTCEWLKLSVAQDRFGSLCDHTSVAFHCPATCSVCHKI